MENKRLIEQAQNVMLKAYAPYSKFQVGAALVTTDGKVFTGCNIENISFGGTICAERVAVTKAVSEGYRSFKAIAIVSSSGDFTFPCGICRQFLLEFGKEIEIIVFNGKDIKTYKISELLPAAFDNF